MCPQYNKEFPGLSEPTGTPANQPRWGWEEPTELGRQPEKGWEDRPMESQPNQEQTTTMTEEAQTQEPTPNMEMEPNEEPETHQTNTKQQDPPQDPQDPQPFKEPASVTSNEPKTQQRKHQTAP